MSRVHWPVDGRDWPNRTASRFVETERVRWHVQIMGAGPILLLLHGTGAATHSWRDLAPLLAESFTVVAPDLPGHGFTTGRPSGGLAMPALARAVAALLAQLELAPALLVGHSAGAAIALRMVLDGVARPGAVVGLAPALLPFPGLAAQLFPTLARALFVNPFAPHLFAALARAPGEVARMLERSTGSSIDPRGIELYRRLFATSDQCAGAVTMMADWDLAALARDLPRVDLSVLLLHGDRDAAIPLASVEAAAAAMPRARLDLLPGLGHLAHEEQPAGVAATIRRFASEAR